MVGEYLDTLKDKADPTATKTTLSHMRSKLSLAAAPLQYVDTSVDNFANKLVPAVKAVRDSESYVTATAPQSKMLNELTNFKNAIDTVAGQA